MPAVLLEEKPAQPQEEDQRQEVIQADGVNIFYGKKQAIREVSLTFAKHKVTALIGPSGCGKSTFLRSMNRMNDLIEDCTIGGHIWYEGVDINDPAVNVFELRKRIGMVFQRPNPFAKSIYQNVAYGLRHHGTRNKSDLDEMVEKSLKGAALWDEVKDGLHTSALALSGGQQQRLCIARALAMGPDVLLLDEPASALDPVSTGKIEELIGRLKEHYTIVIVTHNMQQAARISDHTAFFYMGEVIEYGETGKMFTKPRDQRTENYMSGKFG